MHETADTVKPTQVGAEAHICAVHKISIPIARMRELVGQDESDNLVTYRCDSCAKCLTCMKSPRLTSNYYSYYLMKYCPVYTSSIINSEIQVSKYLSLIFVLFRGKRQEREAEQNPLVAFSCQEMMTRAARKVMNCDLFLAQMRWIS